MVSQQHNTFSIQYPRHTLYSVAMVSTEWWRSSEFWLPQGTTWNDVTGPRFGSITDVKLGFVAALFVSIGRLFLNFVVFRPLSRLLLPIYHKKIKKPDQNKKLAQLVEKVPSKKPLVDQDFSAWASKVEMSSKAVKAWVKSYKDYNTAINKRKTVSRKFSESCFKLVFYACTWLVANKIVLRQGILSDPLKCWEGYPQHVDLDTRLLYIWEMGLYIHFLGFQFIDTIRKDFLEMFIHHIATFSLLVFSLICGYYRIGVLVLFMHDISDVFLEASKLFLYSEAKLPVVKIPLADIGFVIFALSFLIFRLVLYPWKVVYPLPTNVIPNHGGSDWGVSYYFVGFLLILQALHIYWFYLISVMICKFVLKGNVEGDIRSDSELE